MKYTIYWDEKIKRQCKTVVEADSLEDAILSVKEDSQEAFDNMEIVNDECLESMINVRGKKEMKK